MKRHLVMITFVLCAPVMAMAQSPVDAALQYVPKDAALVVAIPDLHGLASGLAAFGKASGIGQLAEVEPRGLVEEALGGCVEGLDLKGAFLVTMKPGQSKPLLIGTLTDPDAWKEGARAEELDSGLLKFEMRAQTWYAGHIENVGMIAKDEATLRAAMSSKGEFLKRFAPECQAMLGDHQIVVWADVSAWQPFLEGLLFMGQGFMQMTTALSDPQAQALIAMWQSFFDHGRVIVRESRIYGAGIKFDVEGAFGQDVLTVRPDGKIAGYLGKLSKPQGDLLRALPGEPGMIVFGLEWMVPEGTTSFSECVLEAFLQTEQGRRLLQDEAAQTGIGAAKKFYRQLTGYSGSIKKANDGGITATGMYIAEEPEAAFKSFKTASEMWMRAEWMSMMSSQLTMEVAHNVERVGDLNADVYSFSFDSPNDEIKKALDAVYGESMKCYVAPHKEGVAYAMGPGAVGSDAFARMFDSDAARLARDKRIAAARNTIRPNPQACVFLDLPKIAEFGVAIWQKLGGPASSAAPPKGDVPLAAFGVYLERTAMRSEVFVPAASIKQAIDAFGHQDETPPS